MGILKASPGYFIHAVGEVVAARASAALLILGKGGEVREGPQETCK
jgi:hypothetical protein